MKLENKDIIRVLITMFNYFDIEHNNTVKWSKQSAREFL